MSSGDSSPPPDRGAGKRPRDTASGEGSSTGKKPKQFLDPFEEVGLEPNWDGFHVEIYKVKNPELPPQPLVLEHPPQPLALEHPPQPLALEHPPQPLALEHPPQPLVLEHPPQPFVLEHPPQPFVLEHPPPPVLEPPPQPPVLEHPPQPLVQEQPQVQPPLEVVPEPASPPGSLYLQKITEMEDRGMEWNDDIVYKDEYADFLRGVQDKGQQAHGGFPKEEDEDDDAYDYP